MSGVGLQHLSTAARDARRLAALLAVPSHEIDVQRFPDGELRVAAGPAAPTTIIYAPLDQPNEKLLVLLFAAEALRREGAKRLVLLAPYLPYMRQDAAFRPGEAISQRVIGRLFNETFDRVITIDAHLHRTAALQAMFPDIEADDLSAMPAIADALRGESHDAATVVVGPDEESRPWTGDLAARLGLACAVARKTRHGDRSVSISFGDSSVLAGRPILLVDDIVSSGGTLIACAKELAAAGAGAIDAVVTHALFPVEMLGAFGAAGIRSIRSTYSVPHPTNAFPLDWTIATALRNEFGGASAR